MAFDNFRFFHGLEANLPPATIDRLAEPAYTTDTNKFFICDGSNWNQVTTGPAGATGPTGPAGLNGPQWKGQWDVLTPYVAQDAVFDAGSSWICILANSGNEPPNATYWESLAERGATWWSGSGAPTLVVGSKAGDYYLDEDSGLVYVLS